MSATIKFPIDVMKEKKITHRLRKTPPIRKSLSIFVASLQGIINVIITK